MSPIISHKQHIERRDGVCGGKPYIVGTQIRVQDIYDWHELQRRTPEKILADFPQLTLADIHSALAYYFDHREEIQRDSKDAEASVAPIEVEGEPAFLERLRAKMAKNDAASS